MIAAQVSSLFFFLFNKNVNFIEKQKKKLTFLKLENPLISP